MTMSQKPIVRPFSTALAVTLIASVNAFLLLSMASAVGMQVKNQFAQGCLQHILNKTTFKRRMCNSDDSPDAISSKFCRSSSDDSALNYTEIRMLPSNWEASMFYAWINQILLSELMDVPSTIDSNREDCHLSFYDPDDSFCYPGSVYNYDGFEEGNRMIDCTKTDKSCGHMIPDVWHGQVKKMDELVANDIADSTEGNGLVGKFIWVVPKFLVEKDPSFLTYLGLRGEENRRKLAETFKRPTTWLEYCRDISETNCTNDENATGGWPANENDGTLFFKKNNYEGHFRLTEKNNCTLLGDECTGHFVDYGCNASINTDSQLHWMNIALQSEGPLKPNNGYTFSQAVQIWHAANATMEPVIMWYWSPDPLLTEFKGTPAEAFQCVLPDATSECVANQITNYDRCNGNLTTRRGPPERACGYDAYPLSKLITASLKSQTYSEPEASRSPAYDFLRSVSIENLQMDDIFRAWKRENKEPREAVCQWVADNIEHLTKFVPRGYPRIIQATDYNNTFSKAALGLAVGVAVIIVCTMSLTFIYRYQKVFLYALSDFLLMLLAGLLLVSGASIMYTFAPSTWLCIARQWFVTVGNTLSIVPLLVKVSALNKILKRSRRVMRFRISPNKLRRDVAITVLIILIYLPIWTAVDPPKKKEDLVLEKGNRRNVVEIQFECTSSSKVWYFLALGWDVVLLTLALSLAFQTRGIRAEFNESQSLAMLVYSHSMYTVLRVIVTYLSDHFDPDTIDFTTSILLSLDSLFTVIIYFVPKFMKLVPKNRTANPNETSRISISGQF